jgi:uncharacterized protein
MCFDFGAQVKFDSAVTEMLACPGCRGDLRLESECLVCDGCGRRYPVADGIPVLIAERADAGSMK